MVGECGVAHILFPLIDVQTTETQLHNLLHFTWVRLERMGRTRRGAQHQ